MDVISVYILLISFEISKVCGNAFNTYCTLPCPFMCPAQPSGSCGAIQLMPRRSYQIAKSSTCDYSDDDDETPDPKPDPDPKPVVKPRQQLPKPKAKPPPEDSKPPPEDTEPPPKKKEKSSPNSPSIQPSRRFFTSLFSIPGAVVDTLVSGEIVL